MLFLTFELAGVNRWTVRNSPCPHLSVRQSGTGLVHILVSTPLLSHSKFSGVGGAEGQCRTPSLAIRLFLSSNSASFGYAAKGEPPRPPRICPPNHHHHHHQSLNREGRWGTTDDFATSFFSPHFPLFSTALWDLANSRPVHFLMLSSHLFLCISCLLSPFIAHCKMILVRPDERDTYPYYFSLRLFTMVRSLFRISDLTERKLQQDYSSVEVCFMLVVLHTMPETLLKTFEATKILP